MFKTKTVDTIMAKFISIRDELLTLADEKTTEAGRVEAMMLEMEATRNTAEDEAKRARAAANQLSGLIGG